MLLTVEVRLDEEADEELLEELLPVLQQAACAVQQAGFLPLEEVQHDALLEDEVDEAGL
ncbi:hypothetical protein FACS189427_10870 [Planctomycetales bacterium]|nr:hypothetical protein FACS189427_10870 [Planctomycetales bacterium]